MVFASRVILCVLIMSAASAFAQEQPMPEEQSSLDELGLQRGPATADIGGVAVIQVPDGYYFADSDQAQSLLEAMENPTSGNELGLLLPADEDWFVLFEYDATGYIKDDEKDSLDADAILASVKKGTEQSNKERRKKGWSTMTIVGWEEPPHYDEATHNLEWAIRGQDDTGQSVNFNTRLLGRKGVMSATLVTDPATLSQTVPKYHDAMRGFDFVEGYRYAEYREGDKIAKYGLRALVAGGAAAVAVKSGALKGLWKLILFGALAVAAFFKKIFKRD